VQPFKTTSDMRLGGGGGGGGAYDKWNGEMSEGSGVTTAGPALPAPGADDGKPASA